ncbi:MAG: glycosyltransferase [Rhodospirillales bacterium]|nr:glycosyltransferase [Rhodospirillales bacterium]
MISFIIPTLLRSDKIFELVRSLENEPLAREIIIINNSQRPLPIDKLSEKTVVYNSDRNLYVNASWNLGVSLSTYSFIALCNDDISFDTTLLQFIVRSLEQNIGIIGMHDSCINNIHPGTPRLSRSYLRNYGFGTLMFLKRDNYTAIPDDLKIWCGDDYLFYSQKQRNYVLKNVSINTVMSASSGHKEFETIKQQDIWLFNTKYRKRHSIYESIMHRLFNVI